jgi:mono/diheme cytochrome c family protein
MRGTSIKILFAQLSVGLMVGAEGDLPQRATAILSKHCYSCHGPAAMAGLRLDVPGDLDDSVVVPGKPQESRLWLMMNGKGRAMMPPSGKLRDAELNVIREWIQSGAKWPEAATAKEVSQREASQWWSHRPVRAVPVPTTGKGNEIDRFIAVKLAEKGLRPAAEADRATLIRRLSYDLTGLPPTRAEVVEFERDARSDAYERLVERLLSSKRYGEKWAKHWLDLARYGDTGGFEQDPFLLYAWRYRDYVIDSFNADKPYDQFVREQIAGDELFEDPSQQQGTGFYTVGPNRDLLYKVEDINRVESLTDFTDTTASVFLGMTAGCARCHDHKYDPIPQRDYYRMQAIFAGFQKSRVFLHYNAARGYDLSEVSRQFKLFDIGAEFAALKRPYVEKMRAERLGKLSAEIQAAFATDEENRTPQQKALHDAHAKEVNPTDAQVWAVLTPADVKRLEKLKDRLVGLYANYAPGPVAPGLTDVGREAPKTYLPVKGNPIGEEVRPGFPTALGGGDISEPEPTSATTRRRAALAEWIARKENPLTARVMVNRIWGHHFGRGIVATASDFGMRGAVPTHPELLDWLAGEFVARRWSIKAMHRLIVTSATYRQVSKPSAAAMERDPENQYLSHFTRRRLEAEEIRDGMLLVTGNLNEQMHGRPVVPELAAEELYGMSQGVGNAWPVTTNREEHRRRSIYLLAKRTYRMPMLEVFDRPEGVLSCSRRESSTTATQSLSLLNSKFTMEIAALMAERLTVPEEIARQILLRELTPEELEVARTFVAKQERLLGSAVAARREYVRALLNTNEFLYVD